MEYVLRVWVVVLRSSPPSGPGLSPPIRLWSRQHLFNSRTLLQYCRSTCLSQSFLFLLVRTVYDDSQSHSTSDSSVVSKMVFFLYSELPLSVRSTKVVRFKILCQYPFQGSIVFPPPVVKPVSRYHFSRLFKTMLEHSQLYFLTILDSVCKLL